MISYEFVNRLLNKQVHVDYLDSKRHEQTWIEGTLSDCELDEDEEKVIAIAIETDTDFNRILVENLIKIYLKE